MDVLKPIRPIKKRRSRFTKEYLTNFKNMPSELQYKFEASLTNEEYPENLIDWSISDLVEDAKYLLSCYYETGDNIHILAELKEEEPETWRKEVVAIKKWIERMEKLNQSGEN